jgi:hypothetical protein
MPLPGAAPKPVWLDQRTTPNATGCRISTAQLLSRSEFPVTLTGAVLEALAYAEAMRGREQEV